MKKSFAVILLFLAGCFLFLPEVIRDGIQAGLHTCAAAILPALFPFFVLTDLWIRLGYASRLSLFAAPVIQKWFHLPGSAASAILLGSIGGYPTGARMAVHLYQSGLLTKAEAEQTLVFCNNAGPAFVFGIIGSGVFQSAGIGAVLYLVHILSAVIVGIIRRPKKLPRDSEAQRAAVQTPATALVQAITQAGVATIQICAFILFFAILITCFSFLLPDHNLTRILSGFLELANGAQQLKTVSCSTGFLFATAAVQLGTGGLCVTMQTLSVMDGTGLSSRPYISGKLLQAGLSGILSCLCVPFLPLSQVCAGSPVSYAKTGFLQIAVILTFLIIIGGFLKKTSGNTAADPL